MSQKSRGTRALLAGTRLLSAAAVVAFGFGLSLAQQITGTPEV